MALVILFSACLLYPKAAYAGDTQTGDSDSGATTSDTDGSDDSGDDNETEPIDAGEIDVEGDASTDASILPGEDSLFVEFDGLWFGADAIARILDLQGGLEVRSLGGALDLATLSIRGASPQQTALYLNGIPISPATTGVFDFSLLPSNGLAGANVVRGAGALGGALGGIVDFVPTAAETRSLAITYGLFGSFSVGFATPFSAGSYAGSVASDFANTNGDFSFTRHDGAIYTRENNERERISALVTLARQDDLVSEGWTFLASNKRGGSPGLSEFPTLDASEAYTLALAGYTRDWKYSKGDKSVSAYARAARTAFDDPSPFLGGEIDTDQTEYATGVEYTRRWTVPEGIVGVKAAFDAVALDDDAYGNPERGCAMIAVWREFYGADWSLSFAAGAEAASGGEAGWRGKVAGGYTLVKGLTIEAGAARSFRRPTFGELYYPESGYIGGNPDLANEQGVSFDLGPHWKNGRLDASARLFYQRYSDSIQFVPVTLYRIRAENTGAIRSYGVAFDVEYDLGVGTKVSGSLTRMYAEYLDGGLPLAGRAPLKYALEVEGAIECVNWRLNWLHSDSIPVDRFGNLEVSASDDLTAVLSYDAGGGFNVRFAGYNLLDDDLRDSLDFPRPGRAFEIAVEYSW